MSIRREKARIGFGFNVKNPEEGRITVTIDYQGECAGMEDALLVVGDAWHEAMKENGLDPLKGMKDIHEFKAQN